ncbi:hypothetical protein WN51_05594 [Melipona quadrifasciata]|uniref:Uncharacterized protein n=1 Tax=Melipona quadrifasciata TaxID=166423 RepID=A0A0N0BCS4_9HYME|nr:hypothetical protein WN51_05594 [Melipona quadrifasciata]
MKGGANSRDINSVLALGGLQGRKLRAEGVASPPASLAHHHHHRRRLSSSFSLAERPHPPVHPPRPPPLSSVHPSALSVDVPSASTGCHPCDSGATPT